MIGLSWKTWYSLNPIIPDSWCEWVFRVMDMILNNVASPFEIRVNDVHIVAGEEFGPHKNCSCTKATTGRLALTFLRR